MRKPGRPVGRRSGGAKERGRDQTILHLRAKGASNRAIAGKLGLSEKAIRKRLRRLGWQPQTEPAASGLLLAEDTIGDRSPTAAVSENTIDIRKGATAAAAERRSGTHEGIELTSVSCDPNPLDRSKPNEIVLGYSRDGFHWTRPVRTAFIPVSERYGDWNWNNVQSAGGCTLVVGDRLYFYVMGWAGVRGTVRPGVGSIGLATLRRDGFASMDAGNSPATLTTRPVRFKGKHLFVNADAKGKVLRPFSRGNCLPVSADKTLQPIRWKGGDDLSRFAGRSMKFRFHMQNARLYAFWVSAERTGTSQGYVAAGGPGFTGPVDTIGSAALEAVR